MLVKICFANREKVVFLEAKDLTIDKVERSVHIYTGSQIYDYWLNEIDYLLVDGSVAVQEGRSRN